MERHTGDAFYGNPAGQATPGQRAREGVRTVRLMPKEARRSRCRAASGSTLSSQKRYSTSTLDHTSTNDSRA